MTKAICVWYWFIFLPYVPPFLKRKAETVQSDTVGYYHRSKLCCLGIFDTSKNITNAWFSM